MRLMVAGIILAVAFGAARTSGEVCNIKVVTDASPDCHDVESMIHSITARWQEPAEKCWAIFYWNHIARRQTMPMNLHGMECTDPIRQFNDYGYTMCSTIAGINCSIWDAMGYPVKFWDVTLHTVPEVQYGGRFYNRAPKSHIDLLHSFDGGQTWQQSYSLDRTDPPWDVIHYETITDVPTGTKSVLFKYLLNSSAAGSDACSIYSIRMEVNHRPQVAQFRPIEVTFDWSEVQSDYSLVERSHTELVEQVPYRYTINVGGQDHPIMNSLRVNLKGAVPNIKHGYSDGKDAGGEKYVGRWVHYGRNPALRKSYTVSVPSATRWEAGDPQGTKLTDGVVGPPYAGGIGPRYGLCWDQGTNPVITVDLGDVSRCEAFRIDLSAGWPWWDAAKGEVKDAVEVLTSTDANQYTSQGFFDLNLRWKDIPVNHMMPDDETATGFTYTLVPQEPVNARYVQYRITPRRTLTISEVQVLDSIEYTPFDLRIALPDEKVEAGQRM